MSSHVFYKCEKCGTTTENPYSTKGWVHIEGKVYVAAGFYGQGSHRTAYLTSSAAQAMDFCSLACFSAKVEEVMPKPDDVVPVTSS